MAISGPSCARASSVILWLIGVAWALVIAYIVVHGWPCKERFSVDSLPIDLPSKYPRAFYTEMDNGRYEKALQSTFATQKTCEALDVALKQDDWISIPDTQPMAIGHVMEAKVLPELEQRLQASPYFQDVEGKIQIAYEKVVRLFRHKELKERYLAIIELVLYREGKYHGKHVEIGMVITDNKGSWEFEVASARVLGILFEDRFAMFPVEAKDPAVTNAASFDSNNPFVLQPAILMSNEEVVQAVKKQADGQRKRAEANRAVGASL